MLHLPLQMLFLSAVWTEMKFLRLQHVLKSIILIQWQMPLLKRPQKNILTMRKCTHRLNTLLHMVFQGIIGARSIFLPAPIIAAYTAVKSVKYIWKGIKCLFNKKLEVEVLDAVSIGVSIARLDFSTAGSVMFLLGIGELLEEWTRKKSIDDLARCMSLNVDRVWLKKDDTEVLGTCYSGTSR